MLGFKKAKRVIAVSRDETQLYELAKAAEAVMDKLEQYGPKIVPHLLDNDENDGERLRQLVVVVLRDWK